MTDKTRYKLFGAKLRHLRELHDLSQPALEEQTGIDRRNISQLELGKRSPSDANWTDLAKAFAPEEMAELRRSYGSDLLVKGSVSGSGTAFAEALLEARTKRGLSLERVAELTDLDLEALTQFEHGITIPWPDIVDRLGAVFSFKDMHAFRSALNGDRSRAGIPRTDSDEPKAVEDQPGHLGLSLNQLIQEFDGVAAWQKRIRDLSDHDKLKLRDVLARTLEQMDDEAETRRRTQTAQNEP